MESTSSEKQHKVASEIMKIIVNKKCVKEFSINFLRDGAITIKVKFKDDEKVDKSYTSFYVNFRKKNRNENIKNIELIINKKEMVFR